MTNNIKQLFHVLICDLYVLSKMFVPFPHVYYGVTFYMLHIFLYFTSFFTVSIPSRCRSGDAYFVVFTFGA